MAPKGRRVSLTYDDALASLRACYNRAMRDPVMAQDFRDGLGWYAREAHDLARIGASSGVAPAVANAVAAVLSPGNHWGSLKRALPAFLERAVVVGELVPKFATYGANRKKAAQIARTGNLELVSGRKVEAFLRALCGESGAVVVDRHTYRQCGGTGKAPTTAEYDTCRRALQATAWSLGIAPRDFQAALWTAEVGQSGLRSARERRPVRA